MAAITSIIAGITAAAGVAGAVTAYQAGEDQEDAIKKQEAAARAAQAEQEALALTEKKEADKKVAEAQQRLLKGSTGGGGLLYGSELGVTDDKSQTLGG